MTLIALTHAPSPKMDDALRTHVKHEPIDVRLANEQHAAYRRALAGCGAEVRVLDANRDHPDAVFIEDTAVVLDEVAIVTPMGAASRRAEPAAIEVELAKLLPIARLATLVPGATLEGGDVLRVGRTLLVGATTRTNAAGIEALGLVARPLGYDVIAVPVSGSLHLKSACTALPDGALLANTAWLDAGTAYGFTIVPVDESEPHGANVTLVAGHVVMGAASPRTAERIRARGFEVHEVELSEFAKADGCSTCLSLIFEVGSMGA